MHTHKQLRKTTYVLQFTTKKTKPQHQQNISQPKCCEVLKPIYLTTGSKVPEDSMSIFIARAPKISAFLTRWCSYPADVFEGRRISVLCTPTRIFINFYSDLKLVLHREQGMNSLYLLEMTPLLHYSVELRALVSKAPSLTEGCRSVVATIHTTTNRTPVRSRSLLL